MSLYIDFSELFEYDRSDEWAEYAEWKASETVDERFRLKRYKLLNPLNYVASADIAKNLLAVKSHLDKVSEMLREISDHVDFFDNHQNYRKVFTETNNLMYGLEVYIRGYSFYLTSCKKNLKSIGICPDKFQIQMDLTAFEFDFKHLIEGAWEILSFQLENLKKYDMIRFYTITTLLAAA